MKTATLISNRVNDLLYLNSEYTWKVSYVKALGSYSLEIFHCETETVISEFLISADHDENILRVAIENVLAKIAYDHRLDSLCG